MTIDAVSRFTIKLTIHFSAAGENSPQQLAQAVHEASSGIDYKSLLELKRALKKHELRHVIREVFFSRYCLDHFLDKSTVSSSFNSIKAAFIDPVNITGITFLHGTQMGTVIAMAQGDKTLKPGGVVVREKQFCIHGEHNKGFEAVNRKKISGNVLEDASIAWGYAVHNSRDFNPQAIEFTRNPERGVEELLKNLDGYIKDFSDLIKLSFFWDSYLRHDAPQHLVFNFQRVFLIVKALSPNQFDRLIIPKIKEVISCLEKMEQPKAIEIKEKIFEPILLLNVPKYTDEEMSLIKLDIPIIFGSKTVKVVQFKKKGVKGVARPIFLSHCKEYVYRGSLKLEEDIQVIFTSREYIERVRAYNAAHNIALPVLDMDACLIAASYKEYRSRKVR